MINTVSTISTTCTGPTIPSNSRVTTEAGVIAWAGAGSAAAGAERERAARELTAMYVRLLGLPEK
jgi:hypothetical protein